MYDSFLFASDEKGIETAKANFDERFREYVILSQIVTQAQLDRADMNPGRPYALRSAFRTILELNGMQEGLAEFLMGHKDRYNGAYRNMTDDEVREKYQEFEKHLSVTDIIELEDIQKELREELKERDFIIAGMGTRLNEMEKQLKNLSQSLVDTGNREDEKAAQKILSVMLSNPDLLKKIEEELKKL